MASVGKVNLRMGRAITFHSCPKEALCFWWGWRSSSLVGWGRNVPLGSMIAISPSRFRSRSFRTSLTRVWLQFFERLRLQPTHKKKGRLQHSIPFFPWVLRPGQRASSALPELKSKVIPLTGEVFDREVDPTTDEIFLYTSKPSRGS